MEGGTLNLPSVLPALNTATAFNANGKDYATGVSIDLSELTYYPSMPMAQFNNGNGGNIINITENNSRSTFEELDGNRKDIEYITTPENPAPAPLMRSIVLQKSKGKTRDATTSNIVGYIDVNIPPPNINQTIRNNGYYNFNSDWTALVEGTEQNHKLDIQVPADTTTKTITINSIGNNQSTTYNASTDNVDGYSSITIVNNTLSAVPLEDKTVEYNLGLNIPNTITPSSGYYGINRVTFSPITSGNVCTNLFQGVTLNDVQSRINTELGLSNSLPTAVFNNKYFTINNNSVTNEKVYSVLSTGNNQVQSQSSFAAYLWSDIPFIANGFNFTYRGYCDIHVSNDAINWTKVISVPGHYTDVKTYNVEVPQISASWKFYRFNFTGGWIYLNKIKPLFCSNSSYNNPNLILENNKEITLTNNDINSTVYLNPSTGYNGFSNAVITVPNITPPVNNYSGYTSSNPLIINKSGKGSITIPSGYTGLDTIYYNITVPQWSPIKYNQASYYSSGGTKLRTENLITRYVTSEYLVEGQVFICVNKTTNACFGYKCLSTSMTLTLPDGNWYGYKSSIGSSEAIGNATILTNSGDTIISFQIQSGGSSLNSSSIKSFSVQQYQYDG